MHVQITINCTPQPNDDPTSTAPTAPQATTTTLSFVAPPQVAAVAGPILATFARESDKRIANSRRSDKRDDKMVHALDNGKFTAFYYAGKSRKCLGADFPTREAAIQARRAAATAYKPFKIEKANAKRARVAAGADTAAEQPTVNKHFAALEWLAAELHKRDLEVKLVASRDAWWAATGASILVRPYEREDGDDKYAALKVKHCSKLVQNSCRYKDLNRATTTYVLCLYGDVGTPGELKRAWLFPREEIADLTCMCLGMTEGSMRLSRWQQPPYAKTNFDELVSGLRELPRDVDA